MRHAAAAACFAAAVAGLPAPADAQAGAPILLLAQASKPLLPRDGSDAAIFRGSLVFLHYCTTCHGPNADGNGRAARLYEPRPSNLRASDKNLQYMKMIIRAGGKALARSEYMPPWGEELTDEQIDDVASYLQSINDRVTRFPVRLRPGARGPGEHVDAASVQLRK